MEQKEILEALRGGAAVAHRDDMGLLVSQEVCAAAVAEIERLQQYAPCPECHMNPHGSFCSRSK